MNPEERLVEYFFVVGHDGLTFDSKYNDRTNMEEQEFANDSTLFPTERRHIAKTLTRYPFDDYQDFPFPESLGMFCFPNGMKIESQKMDPQWHSFIVTDVMKHRYYAVCITVYEKMDQYLYDELKQMQKTWKTDTSLFKIHEVVYVQHLKERIETEEGVCKIYEKHLQDATDPASKEKYDALVFQSLEKIKLYKQALYSYEKPVEVGNELYVPKSFGLISKWPFFDFFRDYLSQLYQKMKKDGLELPLERYVINITKEIPVPPRGKIEVLVDIDGVNLYVARPPVNKHPYVKNFSFYPIFKLLDVSNIITIVEAVLSERKIVFYSNHLSLLTIASEMFMCLIFPFVWQHVYIPILPSCLISTLQSPVPYLIGIHNSYRDFEDPPEDVVVVALDSNYVFAKPSPTQMPAEQRKKLEQRLKEFGVLKVPKGQEITPITFTDGKIVPTTNKSYKSENSWKLVKPSDFASIFSSETMSTESDELDLSLSSPKHGSDEVIHSPPNNHHHTKNFSVSEPSSSTKINPNTTILADKEKKNWRGSLKMLKNFSFMKETTPKLLTNVSESPTTTEPPVDENFNEEMIQNSLLSLFGSLLHSYRKYLYIPTEEEWNGGGAVEVFKNRDYINSLSSDKRPFAISMVETQAFSQFTFDRITRDKNDYEILYFDEVIINKKNRSALSIHKGSTPFLNDDSTYCISETYQSMKPNSEYLGKGNYKYDVFPKSLKKEYLTTPRHAKHLVNQDLEIQLKSHTSSLTRKARIENQKNANKSKFFNAAPSKHTKKDASSKMTDEERSLMFDIISDSVYKKIQEIDGEIERLPPFPKGPVKTIAKQTVDRIIKQLYEQQDILISAADDQQLVEKSNADDLQNILKIIITKIAGCLDYVQSFQDEEDSNHH